MEWRSPERRREKGSMKGNQPQREVSLGRPAHQGVSRDVISKETPQKTERGYLALKGREARII